MVRGASSAEDGVRSPGRRMNRFGRDNQVFGGEISVRFKLAEMEDL